MVIRKIVVFIFLLVSFSSVAVAAIPLPWNWYGEGNVGYAIFHKNYAGPIRKNRGAWNIAVGYKFFPFFAAEVGYTRYPDIYGLDFQDRHYGYDLAAKLIWPLHRCGIEFFGKAGFGRLNSDFISFISTDELNGGSPELNHYATSYYLGAGGSYYLLPAFLFNLQWSRATGDHITGKIDMFAAGFAVIFG